MTMTYFGIDKNELMRALHNVFFLLEGHNTGVATQEQIDFFKQRGILDALDRQTNPATFAEGMIVTGMRDFLTMASSALSAHAFLNTCGIGRATYQTLTSAGLAEWSFILGQSKPVTIECDTWRASAYLQACTEMSAFKSTFYLMKQNSADRQQLKSLLAMASNADDAHEYLLAADPNTRNIATRLVSQMCGAYTSVALGASPFKSYAIIIAGTSPDMSETAYAAKAAIQKEICDFVKPFEKTTALKDIDYGVDLNHTLDITFKTSEAVAARVAAAFPSEKVICTATGKSVIVVPQKLTPPSI